MNTPEGIKELSEAILKLDLKRAGRTMDECETNPRIRRQVKKLRQDLRAFMWYRLEVIPPSDLVGIEDTFGEEQAAGFVAHDLFDQYCDEITLAESMHEAPEDYCEMYDTVDEVIEAGDEIFEHCQNMMVLAKRFWRWSVTAPFYHGANNEDKNACARL